ncbi:DNA repair protein RadA [Cohaesibacter celericrescens]|uniref:DNA repair protein RadA n=1 Tax=Cohaesibacter celericrescens TaxID=2067669 RepID=A0A2N5XSB2_9HYPH|nr:DNA repair protein RadA [Cohaesibacter celericrescens]PLW77384.1 DNA repair protein RadA [Cohaesibacter celericrescens]
MARQKSTFVCQSCGAVSNQWAGKCESCGEWNSITQETEGSGVGGSPNTIRGKSGRIVELVSLSGQEKPAPRIVTGVAELDRVTGGGFVKGSVLLLGGTPGIGKSTLLIQASAALAQNDHSVVYISGEEAIDQVRLRAARLGLSQATVQLAAETSVEDILTTLTAGPPPDMVVIDSIQTLWTDSADSAPGTVTQVRASAQAMIRYAKQTGAAVILVGHVTKDGQIAGPRVVEHMVDGVLQFEGDAGHQFRLLRALKNRFGPTDEIGVFEMTGGGLTQVANPSAMFLGERNISTPGAAVFAGMEGSRPLLVEIQALVAQSPLGTPRRAVVGWDTSRLSMVLAVLDAHCGVRLAGHDVYLNVAGGLKITEPAADLAVAAALVSSLAGVALPSECVYFGEVSLSGAIRPVAHAPARIKEAAKLGFVSGVIPQASLKSTKTAELDLSSLETLADLVARIAVGSQLTTDEANED